MQQPVLCSPASPLPIARDCRCTCLTAHLLSLQAAEAAEPEEAAGSDGEAGERGMVHQVMQGLLKEDGGGGAKVRGGAVRPAPSQPRP